MLRVRPPFSVSTSTWSSWAPCTHEGWGWGGRGRRVCGAREWVEVHTHNIHSTQVRGRLCAAACELPARLNSLHGAAALGTRPPRSLLVQHERRASVQVLLCAEQGLHAASAAAEHRAHLLGQVWVELGIPGRKQGGGDVQPLAVQAAGQAEREVARRASNDSETAGGGRSRAAECRLRWASLLG